MWRYAPAFLCSHGLREALLSTGHVVDWIALGHYEPKPVWQLRRRRVLFLADNGEPGRLRFHAKALLLPSLW